MATAHARALLRHLRRLLDDRSVGNTPDGQLLERFAVDRDEAAFTALVRRHAGTVFGVCRRVLHHTQDAEDVFQATFLLLARKADTIRKRGSVGSWLYGVAYRLACKAKAEAARRRDREARTAERPAADPLADVLWRDVRVLLDEELARLPDRYRAPLVLCYLEGRTQDEAARQLGWSKRTVKVRLERGRGLLRGRLTRRGLELGPALAGAALIAEPAEAAVPASLVEGTARAALGVAGAGVSAPALALAQGTLREASRAKLRVFAGLLLAVGATGAGVAMLRQPVPAPAALAGQAEPVPKEEVQKAPAVNAPARVDQFGDELPVDAIARLGTVRFRHGESIRAVAFGPDVKSLFALDWHGIHVWELETGRKLSHFGKEEGASAQTFSLSADKAVLASAHSDGVVRLWEPASRRLRGSVRAEQLRGAVLSPDGRTLATLSDGGNIVLWDVATARESRTLKAPAERVWAAVFSPEGKTLIAGYSDGTIRVWNVASGRELRQLAGHTNEVGLLALSPDGKTLASVGSNKLAVGQNVTAWVADNRVRLWDVAAGKELRQLVAVGDESSNFQGFANSIQSLAFSPDGRVLAAGGVSKAIRLWDPATGKELRRLYGPANSVSALAFTPDGATLAVGGGEKAVRLYDVPTGKELPRAGGHHDSVYATAITPDGRAVVTTGWDATLRVWDPKTGKEIRRLTGHERGVMALVLSADGRQVITAGDDQTLRWWDLAAAKEVRRAHGPDATLGCLAVSADGKLLACTGPDKSILLLDAATGVEVRRVKGHSQPAAALTFALDGRTLFSWGDDSTAAAWDVATGTQVRKFAAGYEGRTHCAAFSPDGRLLACGGQQLVIRVYDVGSGKEVPQFEGLRDSVSALAFSPDGRLLASAGWSDPGVRLWEVAAGKECRRFVGHRGRGFGLAFSADGRILVSGNEDTTALVWDVSGEQTGGSGGRLSAAERDRCWKALAAHDAAEGQRAVWQLVADPQSSVPFLRDHLEPVPVREADRLRRLIADLDSEQFAVRQQAAAELEKLADVAVPALRQALNGQPSPEARRRIEQLLDRQDKEAAYPSPERLRLLRAVQALEALGSTPAREVLKRLAAGAPGAWLTEEARVSLARLDRRS